MDTMGIVTFEVGKWRMRLEVRIEEKDAPAPYRTIDFQEVRRYQELSITGVEHELVRGRWRESSWGQTSRTLLDMIKEAPTSPEAPLLQELHDLWERWHLNGMRAGCREQAEALRKIDLSETKDWYAEACSTLKALGLYKVAQPHSPVAYTFGHSWLVELLPDEVIARLKELVIRLGGRFVEEA